MPIVKMERAKNSHSNTLQHITTRKTLQHAATHCNTDRKNRARQDSNRASSRGEAGASRLKLLKLSKVSSVLISFIFLYMIMYICMYVYSNMYEVLVEDKQALADENSAKSLITHHDNRADFGL